jgi:hypothetical protein
MKNKIIIVLLLLITSVITTSGMEDNTESYQEENTESPWNIPDLSTPADVLLAELEGISEAEAQQILDYHSTMSLEEWLDKAHID